MVRHPVVSTNVVAVGYEAEDAVVGTLEAEFRGGAVYRYFGVPRATFEALLAESERARLGTGSVGRFFHERIKGQYAYGKVS
jgi:hypothetical protein